MRRAFQAKWNYKHSIYSPIWVISSVNLFVKTPLLADFFMVLYFMDMFVLIIKASYDLALLIIYMMIIF